MGKTMPKPFRYSPHCFILEAQQPYFGSYCIDKVYRAFVLPVLGFFLLGQPSIIS